MNYRGTAGAAVSGEMGKSRWKVLASKEYYIYQKKDFPQG
jgi:hypothetical protein